MTQPSTTTNKEILIFLAVVIILAIPVFAIAWFILGYTNIQGDSRILAAGQVPVILLLLIWLIALIKS